MQGAWPETIAVKAKTAAGKRTRRRRPGRFRPGNILQRHAYAFFSSLGHLSRRPWASAMTAAVLGVALALPTGLLVGVRNLERLGSGWLAPDEGAGEHAIEQHVRQSAPSLRQDGWQKILDGRTTVAEVLRVTREN